MKYVVYVPFVVDSTSEQAATIEIVMGLAASLAVANLEMSFRPEIAIERFKVEPLEEEK